MMETRPIAVETHVSGRRRMIALSESQREPTDWDRRIHGDPRRAYAGEVVHADLEPANAAADRIARGGTRSGKALASLAPPLGQLMGPTSEGGQRDSANEHEESSLVAHDGDVSLAG
jgi:hypothetical protein